MVQLYGNCMYSGHKEIINKIIEKSLGIALFSAQTIVLLLPLSFQITADCMCEPNSSPWLSWQMARSYRQGEWIPGWEQSSNLDGGSAYSVPDCQKIWVSWNNLYFPLQHMQCTCMLLNPFSQLGTTIIIKSVGKAATFYLFFSFSLLDPMFSKTLMLCVFCYIPTLNGEQGF